MGKGKKFINKLEGKKLIIFDMGNTLLHFHSGKNTDEEKDIMGLRRMKEYLRSKLNVETNLKELKEGFLDNWYGDFYLRKDKLIELNVENYLNNFLIRKAVNITSEECVSVMREFYAPYKEQVVVGENAEYVLKELKVKGYSIGVISNCILYDELYLEIFEEKKLKEYISHFVFSYSNGIRKPVSKLFRKMLHESGIRAEEAVMVGDGIEPDIKGARKVGIKGVWYNPNKATNSWGNEDSDFIEIKDFKELLDLLG